jgi:DNA-directed RNA polymerase subunit alpha
MKYAHLSESVIGKKVSEKENIGIFHVEGLYTGYGVTLGNSLRRVLLSSLPGGAITQIKVKGIDHEFSALPGMVEDIVEFGLNLKKVRFHFFADEPQVLSLHVKGDKEVTAGDIQSTAFVQVINKDLHLATLSKKTAELDMEITVEKGLGYVPSEARKLERLPVGTIVLDAIFSPVVRVAFSVENMRVGDRTDYNRLIVEVETDGSITPSEAFHKTVNILKDHFEKLSAIEVTKTVVGEVKEKKAKKK